MMAALGYTLLGVVLVPVFSFFIALTSIDSDDFFEKFICMVIVVVLLVVGIAT